MKRVALLLLFTVGCGSAEELEQETLPLCEGADGGVQLVKVAELRTAYKVQKPDGGAAVPQLERVAELRGGPLRPLASCRQR